jgi:hypothetical protein
LLARLGGIRDTSNAGFDLTADAAYLIRDSRMLDADLLDANETN